MQKPYGTLAEEYSELTKICGEGRALKFMELSRLDRIAGALEGIRQGLETLSDSTTENPNGTRSIMIWVSGEVGTY